MLHYDWQDSVLLCSLRHLRSSSATLHAAYPCVAYLEQLRCRPGKFDAVVTPRELDNSLVNVTHLDLHRHPLFKDAITFQITVHPGDALLLPAYWFHQVDSYTDRRDSLNVAVNYWFQGHSLATRLYRTLRENLFINCTEKVTEGSAHPCNERPPPPLPTSA